METRANYVAVGIFTLVLVLAGFGLIYWKSGFGEGGETAQLRIRIPGSASGLGRGSAVLFNGVKVGDVRRVFIDVKNPDVVVADTRIDRLTPITRSTRADIGLAGLTGQANIELKGGDLSEPNLLEQAEAEDRIAELTANPSAVTNLLQTAQDIFSRTNSVLDALEGFVTDVRAPLTETIDNAKTFSQALSRNADGIDGFLASVSELSQTIEKVSGRLDSTLASAEELLDAVDREKVGTIVANVESFTKRLETAGADLDGIMKNVDASARSVRELSENAGKSLARVDGILEDVKGGVDTAVASIDRIANSATTGIDSAVASIGKVGDGASETLARVDKVLDGVDPEQVRSALANIEGATVDARKAAADVSALADRFSQRGDDVDQIIVNAREISERLNQASTRVDGVLAKVDSLLGSENTEGVIAEAGQTVKEFRKVAETLNARIGTITDGLARFSGQGLRDVEALVRDSRRSINRIEQAITALERNPQRILTGGEGGVRQYDGRVRR
ncbi:MAG: MlaD family protein [Nitratireductor sp.]